MTSVQLNFNLRASPRCRSVHLIGSWDSYATSLSLAHEPLRDAGSWTGAFRFPSTTMQPGKRYWYYYMIDGRSASHDPSRPAVIEPTTGRTLNVLDIPGKHPGHPPQAGYPATRTPQIHHDPRRPAQPKAKGRSLSPSAIAHPHPRRPNETRLLRDNPREMEALSRRFAAQRLSTDTIPSLSDSDTDSCSSPRSRGSSGSRSSRGSSPGSLASPITPNSSPGLSPVRGPKGAGLRITMCSCERYAVMRDGSRVRVDCGGRVCGDNSSVSSESGSEYAWRTHSRRREGSRERRSSPDRKHRYASKSSRSSSGGSGRRRGSAGQSSWFGRR